MSGTARAMILEAEAQRRARQGRIAAAADALARSKCQPVRVAPVATVVPVVGPLASPDIHSAAFDRAFGRVERTVPVDVTQALAGLWEINHRGQAAAVAAQRRDSPRQTARRTRAEIRDRIAARHRVGLDRLLGSGRQQPLIDCRQECCYAMAEAGYSTPQIGETMNRDHTTVLYACRRYAARMGLPDLFPPQGEGSGRAVA